MKPAVNPYNRACRIRIRPDLGARVVPGWPWLPYDVWLEHRKQKLLLAESHAVVLMPRPPNHTK